VHIVAATGSTGAGASPSATAHHPERFADIKAYKVLTHQHTPEVTAFLAGLGPTPKLLFVPWSAPVDRGIFATVFAPLVPGTDAKARLADAYGQRPLIRLRAESPHLRHVRSTALADLAVHQDGDTAVVLCAIDNLGKGAAAQAVQCLNLAFGLPVDAGLTAVPPYAVRARVDRGLVADSLLRSWTNHAEAQ
jgi:N-acetyl-gamma-glutamylphosphate reductase